MLITTSLLLDVLINIITTVPELLFWKVQEYDQIHLFKSETEVEIFTKSFSSQQLDDE